MDSLKAVMLRAMIGLALFATVTAGLIAVTEASTADRIRQAEEAARSRALLEVVPAELMDTPLLAGAFEINEASLLGFLEPVTAFHVQKAGEWTAVILPWQAPEGYTGPIRGIVAIDRSGKVLGVRITSHKETPGLGDKIERRKSDWVTQFDNLSFASLEEDLWKVKKDGGHFDQMTGATITPRAVVNAVRKALSFHAHHFALLYPDTSTSTRDEEASRHE
ncbi:MAG: electron transport complex subunit RsxG [Hahellaceae bacterium]|nr:electron transport complex subunit RsxG [Hahellaceae bacterium]